MDSLEIETASKVSKFILSIIPASLMTFSPGNPQLYIGRPLYSNQIRHIVHHVWSNNAHGQPSLLCPALAGLAVCLDWVAAQG